MSVHEHKREKQSVNCMVLTVSDTRTAETDKSGNLMITMLGEAGHRVSERQIVRDEQEEIKAQVERGCGSSDTDVILINGGTGIASRDVTIETIEPLFQKEIPGFGELFRMLSYQEDIGSAAILSRAVAGIYNDTIIIATPGSSGAVKLAMERLILPELSHLVREVKKDL